MIFTSERPLSNNERFREWHERYSEAAVFDDRCRVLCVRTLPREERPPRLLHTPCPFPTTMWD